jgi:CheY-like chemotaxis protein
MSLEHDLQDAAVLIVDDIEDNIDLLEEYLEDEVWSVLRASSGQEAVQLAAEHIPDIVLLDLNMPGLNGMAVLRAIRAQQANQDVAIILQTAYADRDNVLLAKRLGCDHILGKPVKKDRLLDEMRACLRKRRGLPGRQRHHAAPPKQAHAPAPVAVRLDEALETIEAGKLVELLDAPDILDALHDLIDEESVLGRRLIRVANSPMYGSVTRVENVPQALVRLGTTKTSELLQKASVEMRGRLQSIHVERLLRLLEIVTNVFPERTRSPAETQQLLRELSRAAASRSTANVEDAPVTEPAEAVAGVENAAPKPQGIEHES